MEDTEVLRRWRCVILAAQTRVTPLSSSPSTCESGPWVTSPSRGSGWRWVSYSWARQEAFEGPAVRLAATPAWWADAGTCAGETNVRLLSDDKAGPLSPAVSRARGPSAQRYRPTRSPPPPCPVWGEGADGAGPVFVSGRRAKAGVLACWGCRNR